MLCTVCLWTCMNVTWPRQISAHIFRSLANKYPRILVLRRSPTKAIGRWGIIHTDMPSLHMRDESVPLSPGPTLTLTLTSGQRAWGITGRKNAGGRLHLNTSKPLTQRSRSGLTMPLCRHRLGTYQERSSQTTRRGTTSHSRLSSLSHCRLILA